MADAFKITNRVNVLAIDTAKIFSIDSSTLYWRKYASTKFDLACSLMRVIKCRQLGHLIW